MRQCRVKPLFWERTIDRRHDAQPRLQDGGHHGHICAVPQQAAIADRVKRLVARVLVAATHLPDVLEVEAAAVAITIAVVGNALAALRTAAVQTTHKNQLKHIQNRTDTHTDDGNIVKPEKTSIEFKLVAFISRTSVHTQNTKTRTDPSTVAPGSVLVMYAQMRACIGSARDSSDRSALSCAYLASSGLGSGPAAAAAEDAEADVSTPIFCAS